MKKIRIFYRSFQILLFKEINSGTDNYEVIYCPEGDEYRLYCDICDKLCFERYYKNHLKSVTHTNNFYKKISE